MWTAARLLLLLLSLFAVCCLSFVVFYLLVFAVVVCCLSLFVVCRCWCVSRCCCCCRHCRCRCRCRCRRRCCRRRCRRRRRRCCCCSCSCSCSWGTNFSCHKNLTPSQSAAAGKKNDRGTGLCHSHVEGCSPLPSNTCHFAETSWHQTVTALHLQDRILQISLFATAKHEVPSVHFALIFQSSWSW